MGLYLNILLLLLGAAQGLLLAILLLRKKAYREGYGFLMLYLGVMITQIALKVVDKYWILQNAPTTYWTSYSLPYLYGPLTYIFVRNFFAQKEYFKSADTLHFIPFFIAGLLPQFVPETDFFNWVTWPLRGNPTTTMLVSLAVYHYAALKIWQKGAASNFINEAKIKERVIWIRQFILHSWWITSFLTCLMLLMYVLHPLLLPWRFGFVLLTFFIYWASYSAMSRPRLFSAEKDHYEPPSNGRKPDKKYANSTLKDEEAGRIITALVRIMTEKKLYTDPELTIERLALEVKTNRHLLSQVLNERLNKSFFDYINSLRVDEAKRLLSNPLRQHNKIAALAFDAGFNSLSVFNDVFKKTTGVTPSEYRASAAYGHELMN